MPHLASSLNVDFLPDAQLLAPLHHPMQVQYKLICSMDEGLQVISDGYWNSTYTSTHQVQ